MNSSTPQVSLGSLWKQFLPLSVSDVTMAAGDPLITVTLARLPETATSLSAIGVAKAIAVFFESPIIMLLHASNALAISAASRRALKRFMLTSCIVLTACLALLTVPWIFDRVVLSVMGIDSSHGSYVRKGMLILVLWPAAIAWRRYHQGLLIRHGNSHAIAHAGFIRLGCVGLVLVTTAAIGLSGVQVAGFALIGGVIIEAAIVTIAAHRCGATNNPPPLVTDNLPSTMPEVWTFYWPLANSMLVVWGGRALLVALVARSSDSLVALAAWPAA